MISSQEFQWCHECWNEQSKQRIDPANVAEFVPVGNMLTIPSDQKITFVERCDGQMQRIARRIGWHDFVPNAGLDDAPIRRAPNRLFLVLRWVQLAPETSQIPLLRSWNECGPNRIAFKVMKKRMEMFSTNRTTAFSSSLPAP